MSRGNTLWRTAIPDFGKTRRNTAQLKLTELVSVPTAGIYSNMP